MTNLMEGEPSKEGRWRAVVFVLNAGLACVGIWAVLRPNNTDVILSGWSAPRLLGIAALVLVPVLAMVALVRPANRIFGWPAMIASTLSAMLGTAFLVEHGLRTMEDFVSLLYPSIALIVGPGLAVVTLWRHLWLPKSRSEVVDDENR